MFVLVENHEPLPLVSGFMQQNLQLNWLYVRWIFVNIFRIYFPSFPSQVGLMCYLRFSNVSLML